eukprot:COSAG02_NODE_7264_length_3090_cov_6.208960_1_plen_161_part_00
MMQYPAVEDATRCHLYHHTHTIKYAKGEAHARFASPTCAKPHLGELRLLGVVHSSECGRHCGSASRSSQRRARASLSMLNAEIALSSVGSSLAVGQNCSRSPALPLKNSRMLVLPIARSSDSSLPEYVIIHGSTRAAAVARAGHARPRAQSDSRSTHGTD